MPTIRLEFDVDSELYPELHAALSRLGSTRARGERMRQLAAAGLVWENVRIHGASAIGPNAPPEMPTDVPPRRSPAPGRAERSPPAERRSTSRTRSAPAAPVAAADDRGDPHFVDLAIDAVPAPPATERRRARAAPRLGDYVERELPVLLDIVAEAADGSDDEARSLRVGAPESGTDRTASGADAPDGSVAQAALHEAPLVPADGATHLPALALKPASRSRLMRMKEKGLFKNG
jgi:hypothetical protein